MSSKKPNKDESSDYAVGDQIKVKLHDGRKVDATIRAVFHQNGEMKLNIDYGHEETATIEFVAVGEVTSLVIGSRDG